MTLESISTSYDSYLAPARESLKIQRQVPYTRVRDRGFGDEYLRGTISISLFFNPIISILHRLSVRTSLFGFAVFFSLEFVLAKNLQNPL